MTNVVIVGGGGHAKVVAGVVRRLASRFTAVGYTDREDRGLVAGLSYLGADDAIEALAQRYPGLAAVIAIGSVRTTGPRRAVHLRLTGLGVAVPPIVSPTAVVADDAVVGEGAQLLDRVVVNPGARIGACAILNTGCIVEHDVVVGDFAHIAPGATVLGDARIGADVLVGAGATVLQGIGIVDGCVIGAGATVTRSLDVPGVYVGVPARKVQ